LPVAIVKILYCIAYVIRLAKYSFSNGTSENSKQKFP